MKPELRADAWLAGMLKKPAFELVLPLDRKLSDEPTESFEKASQMDCFVFSKVPVQRLDLCQFLEEKDFRLIDTQVTLAKVIAPHSVSKEKSLVRLASPSDEDQVAELSRRSFTLSRFHLDAKIQKVCADEIKANWARNFFRGSRGDALIVREIQGQICGFLQMVKKPKNWIIDLIAVDKPVRGKGIAREMIQFAEGNLKDISRVIVGTQIANRDSLRLYENVGFRFDSASYVFHFHGSQR